MTDVQGGAKLGKHYFTSLKPIWASKKISLDAKLKLYNSNVKRVPLNGSESWKTTQ